MEISYGISVLDDSYLAGVQAARYARLENQESFTLVFGSIHYNQEELLDGVRSILEAETIAGCSAYALLCNSGVMRKGVLVVCLNLPGASFEIISEEIQSNEADLAKLVLEKVKLESGYNLGLLFRGYGAGEDEDFLDVLRKQVPQLALFGGLSCGDYDLGMNHKDFWTSWQYNKGRVQGNSLVLAQCRFPKENYQLSFGFSHGWNPITEELTITRAEGMHVFEVNDTPIFDFYEQFLGDFQGRDFFELMIQRYGFALSMDYNGEKRTVVKLPVSCDFERNCITFAPYSDYQGKKVRLLQANRPHVIEGAKRAASRALDALNGKKPDFALVVSCCSRAAFLHSRLEGELKAIEEVLGKDCLIAGYYSGGEIAPFLNQFDEICDPSNPLCSSYYHAGTITVLLFSSESDLSKKRSSVLSFDRDRSSLENLLQESESILDDTQVFMSSLSHQSIRNAETLRSQNQELVEKDEQNQKLQNVVHRYTPHRVWKKAGESVSQGRYEINEEEVVRAFLFMDVKGFTSFSEEHGSEEVIFRLNEIFDPATKIIYENRGDVDKYIGDCIFAVFDENQDAVESALEILKLFNKLKKSNHPFSVRMGIHYGRAIHGNVGSRDRREYTYIGDAVNISQRLESQCEPGCVLVSDQVYQDVESTLTNILHEQRNLELKGKSGYFLCHQLSLKTVL